MQQRDIGRFVIKTNLQDVLSIAALGGQWALTIFQARDVLASSSYFTDLAKIFDQFKINAIKVRIVPLDYESVAGANLQSCIAWDRNGPDPNLNYDQLCSYGSAKLNYYSMGSKTVQNHFIAAETIGEKTSYLPTSTPRDTNTAIFNPYFMLGIRGPGPLGQNESYVLNYAIEWAFDITFRGTRSQ